MSTFSEIWFYTKLSTSALTSVLRILTTEAPVAHQSARHSQRRSAELTCSSSQKPTIVHVHARFVQHNLAANSRRPYPLSPCHERQAERASADQRNQQRGDETILRGRLGGGSTQQVSYKATKLTRNNQQTSVMCTAVTFSSTRVQTESDYPELASAAHAMRGKQDQECANHHARIALLFTDPHAANGIAADPLNKRRRDRCSAAPAVDRKFRASFSARWFFLIAAIPSFRI